MKILALDTSTHLGSVALLVDGVLVSEVAALVRARHGETLLPHIERVLQIAGESIDTIDLIGVGIGPGSFTGLRVGVATAKGLALASTKPLCGVVSLRAIAAAGGAGLRAAVVDAHKGEVYAALYGSAEDGGLVEKLSPTHGSPDVVAKTLAEVAGDAPVTIAGNGYRKYQEVLTAALGPQMTALPMVCDAPRAAHIATEAERAFAAMGADEIATLEPLYVRPSDAKLPGGISLPPAGT